MPSSCRFTPGCQEASHPEVLIHTEGLDCLKGESCGVRHAAAVGEVFKLVREDPDIFAAILPLVNEGTDGSHTCPLLPLIPQTQTVGVIDAHGESLPEIHPPFVINIAELPCIVNVDDINILGDKVPWHRPRATIMIPGREGLKGEQPCAKRQAEVCVKHHLFSLRRGVEVPVGPLPLVLGRITAHCSLGHPAVGKNADEEVVVEPPAVFRVGPPAVITRVGRRGTAERVDPHQGCCLVPF
mmetsp:Transcript_67267/g.146621  ORF Transcript_67267/g.146621 Transcript_67267/m.146621 type:complete len:241 (-) Transcript_67267:35-757(-)